MSLNKQVQSDEAGVHELSMSKLSKIISLQVTLNLKIIIIRIDWGFKGSKFDYNRSFNIFRSAITNIVWIM